MTATTETSETTAGGMGPGRPMDPSVPAPPAPQTLEETGLSASQVLSLTLKTLFQQGDLSGQEIAERVALPFVIIDDVLLTAIQRHFVEVLGAEGHSRAGYRFALTDEGRTRAQSALAASRYVGPAPVPLTQFRPWVRKQSVMDMRISGEALGEAFNDLVLSDDVTASLGPAVNSGASIFLHGAAGNGKTAIAERLGSIVSTEIYIPYSIIVDGHIIVVFDPVYHERTSDADDDEENGTGLVRQSFPYDRRYIRIKRPTVFVGGELTMEQLDLQVSQYSQIYRAPFQLKAAGGVLILDDFGRQRMTPAELLNRWIVPLEKGFDNLTLDTGVRFPVPFDCILIFATNLNPRNLVDEAFLRRIQFKVEVRSPDREAFTRIFRMNCQQTGIPFEEAAVDILYRKYYDPHGIKPRGCHPRDILHHITSISSYEGHIPSLEPTLLQRAAEAYFLVMEEEYQPGIAPISSKR